MLGIQEWLAVGAGTVVYPPGGRFGPRIQGDYQLVSVHSGSMEVYIDGARCYVPAGHMTLLQPGGEEEFYFDRGQETWHRWIYITPNEGASVLDMSEMEPVIPISSEMMRLIDVMVMMESRRDSPERKREALLGMGFAALQLYAQDSHRQRTSEDVHPAVLHVISYIQEHYGDPLTLEQLAHSAGVSREHLVRLFHRHTGMTPVKYVWSYRVEKAVELLRFTGLTVGAVAEQTGFMSPYHFSRAVKERTGRSPTQIRRM